MSFEGVLIAFAQLGVTIAGFAGVVAAFRTEGWDEVQTFRLRVLVRNSLGVVFMALLPSLFFAGFHDERPAIATASVSSALWMAITVIQLQRHWLKASRFWTRTNVLSTTLAVGATALFVVNAVALQAWWPYLTGLALVLMTAALAFQRMIGVRRP